jgi:hypothetical protein
MKSIGFFVLFFFLVGCAHQQVNRDRLARDWNDIEIDLSPDSAEIRTETRTISHPEHGDLEMRKTFRGDGLIMTTLTSTNLRTRSFQFKGEGGFIEADEDLDGFYESIAVYGDTMWDFEMFRRSPDGTVAPIPPDEYLELKEKSFNSMVLFWQTLESVQD